MQRVFDLHPVLLLLLVIGVEACLFAIGRGVFRLLRRSWSGEASGVPVAPFIAAVTTPWALVFTFLAADVWTTHKEAASRSLMERDALLRLENMAGPRMMNQPELAAAVAAYREAVQRIEWGAGRNERPAPQVDAAVARLWIAIGTMARDGAPTGLANELVRSADFLQAGRSSRLSIGAHHVNAFKWLLLLALGLLCHVVIAAVHRDRPAAARLASAIYSAAVVASLWGLAMHASPYSGPAAIEPGVLSRAAG